MTESVQLQVVFFFHIKDWHIFKRRLGYLSPSYLDVSLNEQDVKENEVAAIFFTLIITYCRIDFRSM